MINFHKILTQEVLQIMSLIIENDEQIRIVGGAVRDLLFFDKTTNDIDFATTAKPEKIKSIFKKNGFKMVLVGEKFGSIAIISKATDITYEITSLRSDFNQDGRHAEVIFDATFETDSQRRDFTINALSVDNQGNISDYHGGLDDLKNSIVRFIGNPETRICEDYLRIMRFFRFSAKFGGNLEENGLNACKKLVKNINKISKERFTKEIIDIAKLSSNMLQKMHEIGLFKEWFSVETKINTDYDFSKLNKAQIIAVLFVQNTNLDKLDIARAERKFIEFCWKNWFAVETKIITNELKILALNSDLKDVLQINNYIENFSVPPLPINGNDIISDPKNIGKILEKAKKIWVENDFNITKDTLLKILNDNN